MDILKRTEDMILRIFPGHRNMVKEWEKNNMDLDTEVAKKNNYKRQVEKLEQEREELLRRCYDAIDMVEDTRLKRTTKDKIIDKLRGLE